MGYKDYGYKDYVLEVDLDARATCAGLGNPLPATFARLAPKTKKKARQTFPG